MPQKTNKTVALIVLDGWGYREDPAHNAVAAARKPFFDHLWKTCPHSLLEASGHAVGLPEGQMGNSEVGHTTIGAGTILDTDLVRIKKSIDSGDFAKIPAVTALFEHVTKHNSTLHVQGLLGNGGVHAHSDHLFAFLRAAKAAGIEKVAIHAFTDGRDTAPQSAGEFFRELEAVIGEVGIGHIATATGRFYAMDRDNNWDRVKRAEEVLYEAKGTVSKHSPSALMAELYKKGIMDEHLEPVVFLDAAGRSFPIEKNDALFFFNFRADRARQISKKIRERNSGKNILFATLTEYEKSTVSDKVTAGEPSTPLTVFSPVFIETTLAKEVSAAGLTQAHIAETEKFPHATYFLNGGVEKPYPGEKHIMLESRKDVKTHDEAPEMRAEAIADKAIEEIKAGTDFIFINFANPDMVGHTANVPAIITAIETVDRELQRVINVLDVMGGQAVIIADHGNAEVNIDPITGEKHTAHTINVVPCILTGKNNPDAESAQMSHKLKNGGLSDVAPTVLKLLNVAQPSAMTGSSLV